MPGSRRTSSRRESESSSDGRVRTGLLPVESWGAGCREGPGGGVPRTPAPRPRNEPRAPLDGTAQAKVFNDNAALRWRFLGLRRGRVRSAPDEGKRCPTTAVTRRCWVTACRCSWLPTGGASSSDSCRTPARCWLPGLSRRSAPSQPKRPSAKPQTIKPMAAASLAPGAKPPPQDRRGPLAPDLSVRSWQFQECPRRD
jgi:hypothetical protein